jgi:hypothetical protein
VYERIGRALNVPGQAEALVSEIIQTIPIVTPPQAAHLEAV